MKPCFSPIWQKEVLRNDWYKKSTYFFIPQRASNGPGSPNWIRRPQKIGLVILPCDPFLPVDLGSYPFSGIGYTTSRSDIALEKCIANRYIRLKISCRIDRDAFKLWAEGSTNGCCHDQPIIHEEEVVFHIWVLLIVLPVNSVYPHWSAAFDRFYWVPDDFVVLNQISVRVFSSQVVKEL